MNVFWYKCKNLPRMLRSWMVLLGCWIGMMMGGLTAYGTVRARVNKGGTWVPKDPCDPDSELVLVGGHWYDLGVIGHRVVTNAGVAFLALDFSGGTKDITNMKFHASGTGTTAENVTDTALVTEVTDNARTAGTNSNPSANVYQTVDTISYTGAHAITEHGIFDQITAAGSTLWDRTVFAAINVANGDSIQFTYQLTVNAGG